VKARIPQGQTEVPPTKETICAIYVTFHPDAKFPQRMARIALQVAHVIIVDNGSNEEAVTMLRTLCEPRKVELIENKENLGVATALNQGARCAIGQGYAWALTVDQDSWPEAGLVPTLSEIYATHPERQKVKIIGTNYRSATTGHIFFNCADVLSNCLERETVITSCSLMSLRAFEEVGQFRDDFFIDQVDDEYCLRLRSHHYKVAMSCEPLMVHSLGNETVHKFFWKHPICSNQDPLRRYYIMRNRITLYKKYMWQEPFWTIRSLHAAFREIILIVLLEDQKLAKLRAMLLGIVHALAGRMSRLDNRVLEKL
jgi:rhamnosyltransferase